MFQANVNCNEHAAKNMNEKWKNWFQCKNCYSRAYEFFEADDQEMLVTLKKYILFLIHILKV